MKLTDKQLQILQTLKAGEPMTPTEVGQTAGKSYDQASSWASGGLKALEEKGLVEKAKSKALYLITSLGLEARRENA